MIIEYDGRQHASDTTQWLTDIHRREQLDRMHWRIVVGHVRRDLPRSGRRPSAGSGPPSSSAERSRCARPSRTSGDCISPSPLIPRFPVECGQTQGRGVLTRPRFAVTRPGDAGINEGQALAREPQEVDSPAAARVWGGAWDVGGTDRGGEQGIGKIRVRDAAQEAADRGGADQGAAAGCGGPRSAVLHRRGHRDAGGPAVDDDPAGSRRQGLDERAELVAALAVGQLERAGQVALEEFARPRRDRSASSGYSTRMDSGPKHSSRRSADDRTVSRSAATMLGVTQPWPSSSMRTGSGCDRANAGCREDGAPRLLRRNLAAIRWFSMRCSGTADAAASAITASSPCPAGTKDESGLRAELAGRPGNARHSGRWRCCRSAVVECRPGDEHRVDAAELTEERDGGGSRGGDVGEHRPGSRSSP